MSNQDSDRTPTSVRSAEPPIVRTDKQEQRARSAKSVRSDTGDWRRYTAGEYGEGSGQDATGVGPRNPRSGEQRVDDRPGHADEYGAVAPGRYGAHGYTGQPGHPSSYVSAEGGADEPRPEPAAGPLQDARLRELIRQRLTEDPQLDAREVTIDVADGAVQLSGRVANEQLRTLIENVVENCGARSIDNRLSVS
jgi:hypothetical protein